jgi:hypothetical protein
LPVASPLRTSMDKSSVALVCRGGQVAQDYAVAQSGESALKA